MTSIDSQEYKQHVEIMKGLNMPEGFNEVREAYKEDFEKIYLKAKQEGVDLSNAKEFLNSLSKDELSTLQNFTKLADEIDVEELSDEGAYNLLLHHYEKFDFNGDGFKEDGKAKISGIISDNMPSDTKKAMVDTFNEMDLEDTLFALVLFLKPLKVENGQLVPNNEPITMQKIEQRVQRILAEENKHYSTPELRASISKFWEAFNSNYEKIKEQKAYYGIK